MAANTEFFEALSLLEHERGITAEYLIDKIQAAIVIAVKKNYEVEDDNVLVDESIPPAASSTSPWCRISSRTTSGWMSTPRCRRARPRTSARPTRLVCVW